MVRILLRRLAHVVPVLLIVSFGTMMLVNLAPGDPAYTILGESATAEQVKALHEQLGLDDPLLTRYFSWLGDVLTGNFGTSIRTHLDVGHVIMQKLPVTLELAVLSLLMALLIAIPVGVYAAYRADRVFDRTTQVGTSFLVANPSFVIAIFLIYLFAVQLRLFPVSGWVPFSSNVSENLRFAFLPALTLALAEIGVFVRLLRADMVATLQEDYILAAKGKGLSSRAILVRHALRPSSFSLLTLAGLSFGRTMGGALIVESVFGLPGLGNLLVQSIEVKDTAMVQGVVIFIALSYVLINTLVDSLYSWLDPRVRALEV